MIFESMLQDSRENPYQVRTVFTLDGDLESGRLRSACRELVALHDALRVAFATHADGAAVQIVVAGVDPQWREVDLAGRPQRDRERAWAGLMAEDRWLRFDLSQPLSLRFTLVRMSSRSAGTGSLWRVRSPLSPQTPDE